MKAEHKYKTKYSIYNDDSEITKHNLIESHVIDNVDKVKEEISFNENMILEDIDE